MRVDATDPRYRGRFRVVDARTGLPMRGAYITHADDVTHTIGVRQLADVLNGLYEVTELRVPEVVIDFRRMVILYNVEPRPIVTAVEEAAAA